MNTQTATLPGNTSETVHRLMTATEEDLPRSRWPRQLTELVDLLTGYYRRTGRTSEDAIKEATGVVLELAFYLGGGQLYLPNGTRLKAALLHARIWHESNGRNISELAGRHGITERHVQRILKEQAGLRRLHRASRS